MVRLIITFLSLVLTSSGLYGLQPNDAAATAREILSLSGISGGIIVQLGSGDGKLTAGLQVGQKFSVNGLEADPVKVAESRKYILSKGIYGPVSVEHFTGTSLPYADNLINIVVDMKPGLISRKEIMRVLVPGGVLCFKESGSWKKIVKPRPSGIDKWTHFLHDAGNNAVAKDTVVGPPRTLQWVAPPLWLRSHETPSGVQAMVSSGSRIFYIFDEGLVGIIDERLPDRWAIICRDAFNGKLLWKHPIRPWGWREWARSKWEGKDWATIRAGRLSLPVSNECCLVADGDRLYATLGYRGPLSILNAETGDVIITVKGTEGITNMLASDSIVLLRLQKSASSIDKRRGRGPKTETFLAGVNGKTGKLLWKKQSGGFSSLLMAIDRGRVIYFAGGHLVCLGLGDGKKLWRVQTGLKRGATIVATDGVVLLKGGAWIESYKGSTGKLLWRERVNRDRGAGSVDLFVADGLVWPGMWPVDKNLKPVGRSARAMSIGYDLFTGKAKKKIVVPNLRSFEHHHRCYRNKATVRYMISAMEGSEFMDLVSNNHSENNWLRGACRQGVMPCNGMLYVPADQCFCEPGSKLLGFLAVGPELVSPGKDVPDGKRLFKGPAFGQSSSLQRVVKQDDWPTYRHDPARSGSTRMFMPGDVTVSWRKKIGGILTAPVAANGRVFVAATDEYIVYALNCKTGAEEWRFIANGRIDSPPTIYNGLVLFGSKTGWVYCLRESDGELAWKFLAAPHDRRIGCFDQVESTWPVHGSVLVTGGIAYFTAGRSTYLDGGIRLYALDPASGRILHKGLLKGPFPDKNHRDYSFYLMGANSDVLVAEGGSIFMRQKQLTPSLEEVNSKVLSTKGGRNIGLHVFSTSGLLDGSWYNRTFWMYSKRWPGFQLANQAPKSGQLLVKDDNSTYAVKVFYRRNVHSPMFYPGKEGYLVFADKNTTEPQIVGEEGSRKPLRWLPQSDFSRASKGAIRKLESPAFGLDKMIGYTRSDPPLWKKWIPVRVRAMVKTAKILFVAGPPDVFDAKDPFAAFEGRKGASLEALSAGDGSKLSELKLDSPPVFDGMIGAAGCLFISLKDGSIACFRGKG